MRGSFASHIARKIAPLIHTRPGKVVYEGGAVSFTFDDFPKTALENGGKILERHGVRGTYYASLGLAGTIGDQGEVANLDEMRRVHERGHELACHGYRHIDYSRTGTREIREDLRLNGEAFDRLLEGFAPTNFAYPYGRYLLSSRRVVAPRFASCRGTTGGINHGLADFADLRGSRVYAPQFNSEALCEMIDRSRAVNGWTIFYTHDVTDMPSQYGCTPDQLETLLAYAVERVAVLPVRDVIARLH